MKKRILYWIILFMYTLNINSQQKIIDFATMVPPSPEVAELAKYVSVPVNLYTGVPNISIPLGEIVCKNLNVPLTLSYHAGGIQVDQIASNVGLGWSLNAGGVISQTVNGLDDLSAYKRRIMSFSDFFTGKNWITASEGCGIVFDNVEVDTEPDYFRYNFLNYSGQFLYDLDRNFYNVKYDKDITFSEQNLNGNHIFQAIDLYGNKYYFADREENDTYTSIYKFTIGSLPKLYDITLQGNNPTPAKLRIPTAYNITKMCSYDKKDSIQFIYKNETIEYESKLSGRLVYSPTQKKWEAFDHEGISSPPLLSKTKFTQKTKKTLSIEASNGDKAIFEYNPSDRTDMPGSKALKKITLYKQGAFVKEWTFEYEYFTSQPTSNTYLDYRLKLKKLTCRLSDNSVEKYKFDYYFENATDPKMPYRNAYTGQDTWGYCNTKNITKSGAEDIRKLFSKMDIYNNLSYYDKQCLMYMSMDASTDIRYPDGSDKNVNSEYQKAYSLKNIHYPTGGKTEFIYEPNDYSYIGSMPIDIKSKMVGGQRIKEIRNYSDSLIYTKQVYTYKESDEDGARSSGALINEAANLIQISLNNKNPGENGPIRDYYLAMQSNSASSCYSFSGDFLGYSTVIEKSNEGTITHNFYSPREAPEKYKSPMIFSLCNTIPSNTLYRSLDLPYPASSGGHGDNALLFDATNAYSGASYKRGLPSKNIYKDKDNKEIYTEEYIYTFTDGKIIYGMTSNKSCYTKQLQDPGAGGTSSMDFKIAAFAGYQHILGKVQLKEKITKKEKENPVTLSEMYSYNEYDLLSKTEIINSQSVSEIAQTLYASDIKSGIYNEMKSINMINYPIETTRKVNNKVVSSDLITYKKKNNTYVPEFIFKTSIANPLTNFISYDGSNKDSHYYQEKALTEYDKANNIVEIVDKSGSSSVLLWGYRFTYVVAVIRNARYSEVIAVMPNLESILSNSTLSPQAFAPLREKLPNAQITSYTYSPELGMTSMTTPQGLTYQYDYYSLDKLKAIKDLEGNIISCYKYQYKNH